MAEEDQEVVLLSLSVSMYGMRAMVALAEKGIHYEYKEEDLGNQIKSPLLLEMNPILKKVPVLVHNGKPICESLVIVEYIDEVWKDKAPLLMPSDPYQKAQAKFWAQYIDNKVADPARRIWRTNGEKQEEAVKEFTDSLKLLEGELGEKPYLGGDTFGFLDIALVGFSAWFSTYEMIGKFSIEKECPKLIEWAKRCLEKESVSKSLPQPKQIYDFAMVLRKKMGLE